MKEDVNNKYDSDVPVSTLFRSDGPLPLAPEQRTVTDTSNILTIIGTITSQIALITALLYYFGWVYTHSFYDYFGIDTNLVGYNTADYVLRSINIAFLPFIYLAFGALTSFGVHRLLMAPALMRVSLEAPRPSEPVTSGVSDAAIPRSARPGSSWVVKLVVDAARTLGHWRLTPSSTRWIIGTLRAVAILLAATVFAGVLFPDQFGVPMGLILPLFLMLSVSVLGYIAHVRSMYTDALAMTSPAGPTLPSRGYILILLTLGLVAGLWAVSIYGSQVGNRLAVDFGAQLSAQPGVVIYSTERIALTGPGVVVSDITQSGTKYHYEYSGLRLLVRAPEKLLLLPTRWQHGRDRVFFVRDDDSIRMDIVAVR